VQDASRNDAEYLSVYGDASTALFKEKWVPEAKAWLADGVDDLPR
jgi:hypothetical protein